MSYDPDTWRAPLKRTRVRRERESEVKKVHEFLFGKETRKAYKLAGTAGLPDRMMVDKDGMRMATLALRGYLQSGYQYSPEKHEEIVRELMGYILWFVEHKAKNGRPEPRQKRELPFLRDAGLTVLEARDLG